MPSEPQGGVLEQFGPKTFDESFRIKGLSIRVECPAVDREWAWLSGNLLETAECGVVAPEEFAESLLNDVHPCV